MCYSKNLATHPRAIPQNGLRIGFTFQFLPLLLIVTPPTRWNNNNLFLAFICYSDRNIDGVTEKAMPPRKLTVEQVIATSRLLKWWIRKRKSRSRWKRSTRKIQTINSITSPVPLSHDLRSRLVLESILDTTHYSISLVLTNALMSCRKRSQLKSCIPSTRKNSFNKFFDLGFIWAIKFYK